MSVPSVLGVYAHPDDESLSCGGVLARHASAGARTSVVTATWAPDTPRVDELASALKILGAQPPLLLGYADARVPQSAPGCVRLCDAPLDQAVQRLVAILRSVRPDIVITHDAYGGLTGHPDHVQTHRIAVAAVQAAALPGMYPQAGDPWKPAALYLATFPHSAADDFRWVARPGKPAPPMHTVPDHQITATLDVSAWLDQKWDAIKAHRSETRRGAAPGLLATLPADVRARVLSTEWYQRHDTAPSPGQQTALTT